MAGKGRAFEGSDPDAAGGVGGEGDGSGEVEGAVSRLTTVLDDHRPHHDEGEWGDRSSSREGGFGDEKDKKGTASSYIRKK